LCAGEDFSFVFSWANEFPARASEIRNNIVIAFFIKSPFAKLKVFGVRRQSEAATALLFWRPSVQSKAVSRYACHRTAM
jgi:hypothetical protein